jgi:hypothetical protein
MSRKVKVHKMPVPFRILFAVPLALLFLLGWFLYVVGSVADNQKESEAEKKRKKAINNDKI